MADIKKGLEELAADLEKIAQRVTDQRTRRRVLEVGASPIVDRSKRAIMQFRRTGALNGSIHQSFNTRTEGQAIGWGNRGFYGRFYEDGYRPITGNRRKVGGRWRWTNRRPSGRTIQRQHIRPAFVAERETVFRRMIAEYQKEVGGAT